MGRVFSYEQATSGNVPSLVDFSCATTSFRERIRSGVEDGVFDGGIIFGSVGRGTPNLRSDFDALIALSDDTDDAYQAAYALSQDITQETNGKVLIEPKIYPKDVLASGEHDINYLFGTHLKSGYRLVDGTDPADYLVFNDASSHDTVADYVYQKVRKLSSRYMACNIEAVADNGLQRMLELPNSLGRKVVQGLVATGSLHSVCDGSDKAGIFELTDDIFYSLGLHDDFAVLTAANNDYTNLLEKTIHGDVSKKAYNDMLIALHGEMPRAIKWSRRVGQAVLPLLEGR